MNRKLKFDDPISRTAAHFRREAMHLRRLATSEDAATFALFVKAFEDRARVTAFLGLDVPAKSEQKSDLPPAA